MLAKFERAVERMVERGISGAFRLRVQPAEIGRRLERSMLDGRRISVGSSIVPNHYLVWLHPDDAAAFSGWEEALCREMERWLAELAFTQGFATIGAIVVRLEHDTTVSRRTVRTEGAFTHTTAGPGSKAPDRSSRLHLIRESSSHTSVTLETGGFTVGRADDNNLVLSDPEVSRYHARFDLGETRWKVSDLGSTNGTWVNDEAVERATVNAGDVVAFGRIRFRLTE